MQICVIGLGYIGLPTAAILASSGHKVVGVDVNQNVVDTINQGKIHIIESNLDILVKKVVEEQALKASLKPCPSDVFIVCVPTPFKAGYEPNLDYIKAAAKELARVLKKGDLVILESTSPVGTTQKLSKWLSEERKDLIFPHQDTKNSDIFIAYCPERVLPGKILEELVENDRIIGGITPQCTQKALELYRSFVKGKCLDTNAKTAEMVKLVENSSRDVQIAFANELSLLCDKADIDVYELIRLANHHPRVNILQPGCGVGGHCIAVDPWFLVYDFASEARLIKMAREVNDSKPLFVTQKIIHRAEVLKNKKIACLGLAFKPDIDDLRESPAVFIVSLLIQKGYEVAVVEPNIKELPQSLKEKCQLIALNEALKYENIALLVGHKEFKNLKLEDNEKILDFCGIEK
ncbi:UDP-N-acetyl-D-mannosamine dehydrogenase [Campylobacter sp. MIT 99-7217]|uniref:UDP-N-acetyl-D-mannosamine dehydrogenase n=1 Tax=Campylobacter sp. MIT 99-7217 TaxID=535091 RepID=UPI001156FEB3|nr:UDP-N-acetyl-D-mannosamine dehydrogenase [Campylobacter sp. MIT 99-7217]TQR28644.1 UDP-N-acetyl-D-mannosamine dehydrogenase [Campylobacter sp. MIT 99-7217]